MATGVRVAITLACTECKRRNYQTQKSKRNDPGPRRVLEVLPLVREAHAAPGDPLDPWPRRPGRERRAKRAAREQSSQRPSARSRAPRPARPGPRSPSRRQGGGRARARRRHQAFHRRVVGRAQEGRVADADAAHHRARSSSSSRASSSASTSGRTTSSGSTSLKGISAQVDHVPLVCHQHVFRPREQGEGQPRAPDRLDEPGAALPPRRRPDRAGDRDEGRPEGADREARAARATCS